METQGLIDSRNINLWNDLLTVRKIHIQFEKRGDYAVYSKNDTSTIFVPIDERNPASFTHELLHIYLRTKGIFIAGAFTICIKSSLVLAELFSDKLIEHIGNCLDHIKMLPEFIRLGFDADEFLSDSFVNKLTYEELAKIRADFKIGTQLHKVYNATAINCFVGKYFAAIACPNKRINYSPNLNHLRQIEEDLYQILEDLSTAWKSFDCNDQDPLKGSYRDLLFEFVDKFEDWTKGKTII